MTDSTDNNSVTKLNTQLNKTMILMEDVTDPPTQNHKRKSITINTKTQPSSSKSSPIKSHRSILKKRSGNLFRESNGDTQMNENVQITNGDVDGSSDTFQRSSSAFVSSRPHTVI